jgi:hypothetical protein
VSTEIMARAANGVTWRQAELWRTQLETISTVLYLISAPI